MIMVIIITKFRMVGQNGFYHQPKMKMQYSKEA